MENNIVADATGANADFCRNCHGQRSDEAHEWDHKFEPWGSNLSEKVCPQCLRRFVLTWNDYSYDEKTLQFNSGKRGATLVLRGCASGGIYDVYIKCPHCDYREEL